MMRRALAGGIGHFAYLGSAPAGCSRPCSIANSALPARLRLPVLS